MSHNQVCDFEQGVASTCFPKPQSSRPKKRHTDYTFLLNTTQIENLGGLSGLRALRTLRVTHNALTDIKPLKGLACLRELW
jgi:Leucine-rich repeat (LRR) protein